jgi:hypothetical protein
MVKMSRRLRFSASALLALLAVGAAQLPGIGAARASSHGHSTYDDMRTLKWSAPQRVAVVVPAASFPTSIYLYSGQAAEGITKPGCPSPVGLSSSQSTLTAGVAARQIDVLSLSTSSALSVTDTTMWPNVILQQVGASEAVSPSRLIVLRESFSDMSVTSKCGKLITSETWVTEACPSFKGAAGTASCTKDPALTSYYYFVARDGHWLITFVYP